MAKKYSLIFLFLLSIGFASAFSWNLEKGDRFAVNGKIQCRTVPDFKESAAFEILNHEGGLKALVVETGMEDEAENERGIWIKVRNLNPIWCSQGIIEKYTDFWIFLEDGQNVLNLE